MRTLWAASDGVGPGQGGGAAGEGELAELAAGERPGLSGHGREGLQRLKRAAAAGRQRPIRAGGSGHFPVPAGLRRPMVSVPASRLQQGRPVGAGVRPARACHTRPLGDFRDTAPIPAQERRPLDYTFHPDPSPSAPPPYPRAPRLGVGRFLDDFRALGRTGRPSSPSPTPSRSPSRRSASTTDLISGIRDRGFAHTTPIQSAVLPLVRGGGDIVACAETGTGKTAAFVLPLVDRLLAAATATHAAGRRPRRPAPACWC